jgi:hypothetical protein
MDAGNLGKNWRAARGAGGAEDVVEKFEARIGREPLDVDQGSYRRRCAGLKERLADVTEQAAMFRCVMSVIFGNQRRRLRKKNNRQQQKYP